MCAKLKKKIIHKYTRSFWSLPTFGSIEEDDTLVELFAQEQESPTVYNGDKINIKIHLGDFSWNHQDHMKFAIKMIENYVKNVGGEIRAIKTKRFKDGLGKTTQIRVPKDAPYCRNLEKTFDKFLNQHSRVIDRYKLRHEEHKQLPEKREEVKYIENHTDDSYNEKLVSMIMIGVVAFILVVLF